MKGFIVLRIANKADGSVSVPANAFETQQEADAQYCEYRKMANAGDNPSDTVILMTNTGFILESKVYTHEIEEAQE